MEFIKRRIRHFLLLGTAWLLIAIGVMLFLSPIPFGIFFVAFGLSILVYTSEKVTRKVTAFRRRHVKFNASLVWVENKLNHRIGFVSSALTKTRPE